MGVVAPQPGFVVQRGRSNYAGPNCPGRNWTCTTARQVILQRLRDAEDEARYGRYWMDVGTGGWDSEGRESEIRLDRLLTQLLRSGWFDEVRGIVVGQLTDCGPSDVVRALGIDPEPLGDEHLLLEELGAVVIDADKLAREVVAPGTDGLRQVV